MTSPVSPLLQEAAKVLKDAKMTMEPVEAWALVGPDGLMKRVDFTNDGREVRALERDGRILLGDGARVCRVVITEKSA